MELTIGDRQTWFEEGDTWTASSDRTLGVVRPVALISVLTESQRLYSFGGLYKKREVGSSSPYWLFALT